MPRWTADEAMEWYDTHQWLVGCNFIPSTAVNQLEMWQAETYDPQTIDKELVCTEYMARDFGSTFETCLPILKEHRVDCYNWQTIEKLEERKKQGKFLQPGDPIPEPKLWFHDILRVDGTPYAQDEIDFIKQIVASERG